MVLKTGPTRVVDLIHPCRRGGGRKNRRGGREGLGTRLLACTVAFAEHEIISLSLRIQPRSRACSKKHAYLAALMLCWAWKIPYMNKIFEHALYFNMLGNTNALLSMKDSLGELKEHLYSYFNIFGSTNALLIMKDSLGEQNLWACSILQHAWQHYCFAEYEKVGFYSQVNQDVLIQYYFI